MAIKENKDRPDKDSQGRTISEAQRLFREQSFIQMQARKQRKHSKRTRKI